MNEQQSNIKDTIFLCPFCTTNISIINSFSHPSNSQLLLTSQCNNQSHQPYLHKKYSKFYNCLEKCPVHNSKFIQFQCITCNTLLCSQCREIHLKEDNTHRIIGQISKSNKVCNEHHNQIQFYCKSCMEQICEKCRKTTHNTHVISEDLIEYLLFEKNGKLNELKEMKTKQIAQIKNLRKGLLNVKKIMQQEILELSETMSNNENILRSLKDNIVVPHTSKTHANKETIDTHAKSIYSTKEISNNRPILRSFKDFIVVPHTSKTYANKETIDTHAKSIYSITEISNNRFIFGSTDNKITIWDHSKNKSIGEFSNTDKIGVFIPILNDTNVAVVTKDKDISIYYIQSNRFLFNLSQHETLITSLHEITKEEPHTLLSSSFDGTVILWNLKTFKIVKKIIHPITISKLSLFPDQSQLIFISEENKMNNVIVSSTDLNKYDEYLTDSEICGGFAFLKNNIIAMYNKRFEVVRFDLNSNSFTNLKGHKQKIIQMLQLNNCAIKEECAATFSVDKTVKVWNIIKGEIMYDLYDTNTPVKGLEMPNGNMAVLYENKIVKIFRKISVLHTIKENEIITDIISMNNNNIVLTTEQGIIQIYS